MNAPLRRPGGRWRVLVHEWAGREPGRREGSYGRSHGVAPTSKPDGLFYSHHHLPNTEFDELVVGQWLHVEQMDIHCWAINIAGVVVHVWADRDGRPTSVVVHGPNEFDYPRDGVEYVCAWGREGSSC